MISTSSEDLTNGRLETPAGRLLRPLGLRPGQRSLAMDLSRDGFWALAGSVLTQGVSFLAGVAIARLLGTTAYGELGMVLSTATLFATLAAMGLGVTATKHVAEHRTSNPGMAGAMIGLALVVSAFGGLVIATGLVVFAPFLGTRVLTAPHLQTEIRISAIMIVAFAIDGGQKGALAGFRAFRAMTFAGLFRAVITLPVLIIFVRAAGLRGAVIGYCIIGLMSCLINQILLRPICRTAGIVISYRPTPDVLRVLWSFSVPVLVAGLSFSPAVWAANALLARNAGYVQMGIFSVALQWQSIILFPSNALSQIGLPMLAEIDPDKDRRKYLKRLWAIAVMTSAPAMFLATLVALFSDTVMALYGPTYRQGAHCLTIIAVSAVLISINIAVGHAIWSLGAAMPGMLFALLRGAVLVLCACWLSHGGATGLAMAYAIMGAIQTIAQIPYLYYTLKRRGRVIGKLPAYT